MFKEYDIVISKKDLTHVPKGSRGAIVLCYEGTANYEVEFVDNEGNTIDVTTVSEDDLLAATDSTNQEKIVY